MFDRHDKKDRQDTSKENNHDVDIEPGKDCALQDGDDYTNPICDVDQYNVVEPKPDKGPVLNYLKQKLYQDGPIKIFVPVCDLSEPNDRYWSLTKGGVIDAHGLYLKAREIVCRKIGLGMSKVYPTWSPKANWAGITFSSRNLILINIADKSIQTLGKMQGVIIHELAHARCGTNHQHNLIWSQTMEKLYSSFMDAPTCPPCIA